MILHEAVEELKEVSETMGIDDCDLLYRHLPGNEKCMFCEGEVMEVAFGGRVAECTTPDPFTAKMKLENLYGAPLSSAKTRAAATGALNAVSSFLMLTRKSGQCNSVFQEDCIAELVEHCSKKTVYIIGTDIPDLPKKIENMEEADLILVNAFLEDADLEEIAQARETKKEIMIVGPNGHGIAALLHIPIWCPYGK